MLSLEEATKIIQDSILGGTIQASISYRNLYLFQVFTERPFEEEMDPFYSVSKDTGEFRDFSILEDGNVDEIVSLFVEAKKK